MVCCYTHPRQFVTRPAARVGLPLRSSLVVLFSLAYAVVRLVLEVLIVHGRTNAGFRAEVLALRHQLRVLERHWQPRDPAPLASGAGPSEMGRLPETTAPSSAHSKERAPPTHPPPGWREHKVGLSPHSGRDLQARPPLLPLDRPQSAPSPRLTPSTSPRPAHLARIRSP